ncbi:MAG: hypothetical protein K0R10_363 [Alphaproteobacteria bacterium]|jgi:hypothetical protein|nr:hypothetical protein [Alphaproteobacteria bacterium]
MAKKPLKYASVIEQSCGAGETLLLVSRLHWIFLAKGLFWLVCLLVIGIYLDVSSDKWMLQLIDRNYEILSYFVFRVGNAILPICAILGLIMFLIYFTTFFTTVVALTTKRLMIRKGLLFVKMTNVDIEEIKGEHVDNGMLGRWLNYGEVHMDARFVANFYVPNIEDPYQLIRTINETRAAGGDTVIAGQASLKPAAEVGQAVPLSAVDAPTAVVAPPSEVYVPVQQPVVVAPAAVAPAAVAPAAVAPAAVAPAAVAPAAVAPAVAAPVAAAPVAAAPAVAAPVAAAPVAAAPAAVAPAVVAPAAMAPAVVAPAVTAVATPQAPVPPTVTMRAGDLPADMQVDVTHHVVVEQPVEVKIVDKDDAAAKKKADDMLETFTLKA